MKITLWGNRSQIATPGERYKEYGGNTLCIEVRDSNDNLIVIDLGTGAKNLGPTLVSHKKKLDTYNILISSVQYDRILGLPFFVPIFIPNNKINIYGPRSTDDIIFKRKLSESMSYVYFPVRMDELKADIRFNEIEDDKELKIGNFSIFALRTNYITDCYAYKVKADNKSLVYISSNETNTDKSPTYNEDMTLTEFCKDADILIHETFFWKEKENKDWGRSSFIDALKRSAEANVKKLIMCGLNPNHNDDLLNKIYTKLKKINEEKNYNINFDIGKEGSSYEL